MILVYPMKLAAAVVLNISLQLIQKLINTFLELAVCTSK